MQDYKKRTEDLEQKVKDMINKLANVRMDKELADDIIEFSSCCLELSEKMKGLYTPDENDKYPLMTLEQRDEFLKYYANIIQSSNNVIKKNQNLTALNEVADYVKNFATQDIKALIKMDKEMDLPSIIQEGRAKRIDITNTDIKLTGGNMSQRMIFENNGKKSVFTEDTFFNINNLNEEFENKFIKSFPEFEKLTKPLFDDEKRSFINVAGGFTRLEVKPDGKVDISFDNLKKTCPKIANVIEKLDLELVYRDLEDDPDFSEFFYNFCDGANKYQLSRTYSYNYQKLKVKEPVAERNSGMSIVAELLGCKNILAHAESAIVIKDGKEIKGNLMDFAEGLDLKTIKPDNPILKEDQSCLDTKETKKQMADLQVIDYICGNIDRHGQNMFYKFDKNNKCIGIMGIDNDGSFGMTDSSDNKVGTAGMAGYATLGVISESMAERIKLISPEMLELALKGTKISKEAIDCAMERFSILRNMILDKKLAKTFDGTNLYKNGAYIGPKSAKINVISDDKWDKLPLDDLANTHTFGDGDPNIYTLSASAFVNAKKRSLGIKEEFKDRLNTKFNYISTIRTTYSELDDQNKELASGIGFLRGSSKQYNDIKKDIKKIQEAQFLYTKTYEPKDLAYLKTLLNKAVEDTQKYLDRKEKESKTQKFTDYTKKRIKIMTNYHQYLQEKIATIESGHDEMENKYKDLKSKMKELKEFKEQEKVKNIENTKDLQNNLSKKDVETEKSVAKTKEDKDLSIDKKVDKGINK